MISVLNLRATVLKITLFSSAPAEILMFAKDYVQPGSSCSLALDNTGKKGDASASYVNT